MRMLVNVALMAWSARMAADRRRLRVLVPANVRNGQTFAALDDKAAETLRGKIPRIETRSGSVSLGRWGGLVPAVRARGRASEIRVLSVQSCECRSVDAGFLPRPQVRRANFQLIPGISSNRETGTASAACPKRRYGKPRTFLLFRIAAGNSSRRWSLAECAAMGDNLLDRTQRKCHRTLGQPIGDGAVEVISRTSPLIWLVWTEMRLTLTEADDGSARA